ncbi:MAG: portal protein [Candidatus Tectimicrobiota bacterium]|nr:MAG: portal protein [Candidatus Tectomicrobia bacterium]
MRWQAAVRRLAAWQVAVQLGLHWLYGRLDRPLRWMEATLALLGLGSLVALYGFWLSPAAQAAVHTLQALVVWGYFAFFLLRLILVSPRRAFLKRHRLLALCLALVLLEWLALRTPLGHYGLGVLLSRVDVKRLAVLYLAFIQGTLVWIALLEGGRASRVVATWQLRPAQTLVLSFLALIGIGTLLLMLPRATTASGGLSFLDALFTATSAVCVTGLIVVDTATAFTPLGQGILLLLMQLGGLGIITFATVIGMMVRGGIGVREKLLLQDFVASRYFGEISATVRRIVWLTLLIEALGAAALYLSWRTLLPDSTRRLWHAIFHAVSAFCNAGFSTFSTSLAAPELARHPGTTLTVMGLIVLGGLGFAVLWETLQWLAGKLQGRPPRLSVQTRLVWLTTAVLIGLGAGLFLFLEAPGVLAGRPLGERLLGAFFQAVTARTAGFNTLPIERLAPATAFLLLMLMFIGASPGSTGGGLKTTTVAVLVLTTVATIRGKARVEVFRRTIPRQVIDQAYATLFFAVAVVTLSLFFLTLSERQPFLDLFFEEVSAFATVGLSRGITPALTAFGKGVIIVSMFVGRVGSLTLAVALARQVTTTAYEYPTETVMVG